MNLYGKPCLALLVAAALSGGCSSKSDDLEKQLQALQVEVGRLRSANLAMQDRLDGLEMQGGRAMAASDEPDDPEDRPVLEVVRLTPDSAAAEQEVIVATPPDDGVRPIIGGDDSGVAQYSDADEAEKALHQSRKARERKAMMERWKRGTPR